MKACKRTTPAVACATTADLTDALAGHRVRVDGDGTALDLTLCATGTLELVESVGEEGNTVADGTWAVRLADGALVLGLETGEGESRALRLERDAAGTLRVGGSAVTIDDAGAFCDASPAVDHDAQLVTIARTLADRTVEFVVEAAIGGDVTKRALTLCSAGGFTLGIETTAAGAPVTETRTGTWTLRAEGDRVVLVLDAEGRAPEEIGTTLAADGQVLLDDQDGAPADARGVCAGGDAPDPVVAPTPAEIVQQFTAALGNRAYLRTEDSAVGPIRTKIGFCETGRHAIIQTSTRRGPWIVRLVDGAPVVDLVSDPGVGGLVRIFESFALSLDANGDVLLDG